MKLTLRWPHLRNDALPLVPESRLLKAVLRPLEVGERGLVVPALLGIDGESISPIPAIPPPPRPRRGGLLRRRNGEPKCDDEEIPF
jgi:hypothetical protein